MSTKPNPDAYSAEPYPPSYRDAMYVPSRDLAGPGALERESYRPLTLRSSVVAVVVITLLGLAAAIEVALAISTKNDGIPAPAHNVFTGVSPRFLTAFFPTLLVAGLLIIWQSSDRSYRELQPYIVLARGNVSAAEGLLANYSGLSVYGVISNSIRFRHYLILLSTVTTLLGNFLQPLAGSVIQVEQLPQTTDGIFVQSNSTIGLAPDESQLNAFLAAAGFTQAAVFNGLSDPPFISGHFSIARFELPPNYVLNGTLSVNTTAIQTMANCEVPAMFNLSTPGTSNFTIQASNSAGCIANTTFDTSTSPMQYGAVSVPNCGTDDVQFQPVMFWFFHRKDDDIQTPQGASVFCSPTIQALNIIAKTDLNNGSIIGITPLDNVTTSNNVTGSPGNGQAFNSLIFPPSNDTFIHARAITIPASLPGGVQPTFDDPKGFVRITNKVYTQHLAISAGSIYFVEGPSHVPARMVSLVNRLWIDPLPAHALSVVLTLIGLSALFLHLAHSRQRRRFFLAASPGSIAHIIAMTAHARFGEKLYPYDSDETLARKLAGLSFSLDPRTGAVIADRDVGPVRVPLGVVTPFKVPDSRGHRRAASSSALSEVSTPGTYSEDADVESQTARLLPPMDEKRAARERAAYNFLNEGSSRGLSVGSSGGVGEGSSRGFIQGSSNSRRSELEGLGGPAELELQNMRQLPPYFDGRESSVVSSSVDEKRGGRLVPLTADEERDSR
ncbi:hypothetical protein DFH07DRAFT_263372 [Mycena maculata]|uniref:Uncharacterized protein n=1 Tax=Mycena maculata TaxID=230809 RepID=A0AAD7HMZ4_9AGAR|nr:hypothetical protein DFH07DRAFT_263372 [Mycena maculata]